MKTILLLIALVWFVGCATSNRFDIVDNHAVVERVTIVDVSQDMMTLTFATPTGTPTRKLVCDRWVNECIVWK